MKYKKIQGTYAVSVERGEEVIKKLTELCEKENIKAGSIQALGATNKAELLWYDVETKEYANKVFEGENYEITSFLGNVSRKDGRPYLHCHITLGNRDFVAYAGHCKSAIVSGAFEAIIKSFDADIGREFDEETGLNLLKL